MRDNNSERMLAFIDSFQTGNPSFLEELEQEAKAGSVPVIRSQMQEFLKLILAIKKPLRILEVGTAIGFSALLMKQHVSGRCAITTIENFPRRIDAARENFSKYDKENQIVLLEGDAAAILKNLKEPFDFIFMDAAKGQYIHFLPDVVRLMKPSAILISDNVLQDGDVMESRFAVNRRNRTIHSRMRQYLYELKNHEELCTDILPIGDGITISVKKDNV